MRNRARAARAPPSRLGGFALRPRSSAGRTQTRRRAPAPRPGSDRSAWDGNLPTLTRPCQGCRRGHARTILNSPLQMAGAEIVKRYFDALAARDLDTAVALWRRDGIDRFVG